MMLARFPFLLLWFYFICDNYGEEHGKSKLENTEPIKDSPLNFDLEKKKNAPLPSCQFTYDYDIARASLSVICFLISSFVLVFGKYIKS